jgi:hypothetical protein
MKHKDKNARFLQSIIPAVAIAAVLTLSAVPGYAELILPTSTGKMSRPTPGMGADDLMKIAFHTIYSKDSKDYDAVMRDHRINKSGLKLTRNWHRYRIILNRPQDDLDYKDITACTGPENVRGLSILTWTYLSPGRDQDVWLWLPSLRKIRRISQTEGDDSFAGTDFTYEEVVSRKWSDETYAMLGEERFPGHKSINDGTTYYQNAETVVIEARPKRKDWYYDKRKVTLEKKTGLRILDSYFDETGRNQKNIFVYWKPIEGSQLEMEWLLEVDNLEEKHNTIIVLEWVKFDVGLKELFFTERTLMRTKW